MYLVEELAIAWSGITGLPKLCVTASVSWERWAFIPTQHACNEYMYLMYVANCELPLAALGEPSKSYGCGLPNGFV